MLIKDLPDYSKLEDYFLPTTTRFYSSDGSLLAEFAKENRIFLPINKIPQLLINAFLAAEDKNFYSNPGIDIYSILRALLTNIIYFREHKLVGGSTITQQVVKNLVLTNEKSLTRKIKEAFIAFKISKILSKDKIMELYLNKIYLGNGAYGVEAAALKYFNKTVSDLLIEEMALLAALPQAPSKLNPNRNLEKILERRDWVLQRMVEEGFILEEKGVKAQLKPIVLASKDNVKVPYYDYFTEEVRREIIKHYKENNLYESGLYVETTLVPKYQAIANKVLKESLKNYTKELYADHPPLYSIKNLNNWQNELKIIADNLYFYRDNVAVFLGEDSTDFMIGLTIGKKVKVPKADFSLKIGEVLLIFSDDNEIYELQQIPKVNGGIVVLESATGKVLALSGGYDFQLNQFNVATQAMRQPGSLFKPFVYLAALENNFTAETIIEDEPLEISQGPNLPLWLPRNFENQFFGPTSFRRGLMLSRNIVAVQIANTIGLNKISNLAKRFNIYDYDKTNPALVLGSENVTLLKITNAYAMLSNGGYLVTPSLIEKIQDKNGNTLYRREDLECINCNVDPQKLAILPSLQENRPTVAKAADSYQITSLLEGAVQQGTARKLQSLNINIAAKTGTSSDNKDAWIVGYTPEIVVGIYLGFDQPASLGVNATGGKLALPILANFMKEFCQLNDCNLPFKIPPGIVFKRASYNKKFFEAFSFTSTE